MPVPTLSIDQVQQIVSSANDIELLDSGGQKIVFKASIDGQVCVIKFLKSHFSQLLETDDALVDSVIERARREVQTMQECSSNNLVRMGPIGLQTYQLNGETLIYFTEEFISGENLRNYLNNHGVLSVDELIQLGLNISDAINNIWQFSKIHRDIKPANIIKRDTDGQFVLLDMGLVFDLQDDSLSFGIVGTPQYFSPEQLDFGNRRTIMNFRSDLFSLGIVMYEMATSVHPFAADSSLSQFDVFRNIRSVNPSPPIQLRNSLPIKLNDIILRLLAKHPALRYRSINMFKDELNSV